MSGHIKGIRNHLVGLVSFPRGVVGCTCGLTLRNDQDIPYNAQLHKAGTHEALQAVFAKHRQEMGLSGSKRALGPTAEVTSFNRNNRRAS